MSAGAVQARPAGNGGGSWTIDDLVLAEETSQWRLSSDGSLAVWVKRSVEKVKDEEKTVSNLWATRVASGRSWQLTRGFDTVSEPELSPDGRHVAFLSDRRIPGVEEDDKAQQRLGKTQIWALPLAGGEAFPVTRWTKEVEAFDWVGGEHLLFVARESASRWERERQEAEDTARVVDDYAREAPVRLFRVALSSGGTDRMTLNDDWIDQLAVAPNGRLAVITAQQSLSYEFDQRVPPKTFLVDLDRGGLTTLLEDTGLLPHDLRWAPDSSGFYFLNEHTRHPIYREATISELWFLDVRSRAVGKVDLGGSWGVGGSYAPTPDGVVALLAAGVRYRPVRIRRRGEEWRSQDLAGVHAAGLNRLAVSADGGTLVYEYSTATVAPQWYTAALRGARLEEERRLTRLNPGYEGKPTGRVEILRWRGALGEEVEGLLHYPLNWQEGRRYPLILDIHGGPTGVDQDRWDQSWSNPFLLWRQQGAFVLQANYHGSGGYGLDWVESIGEGRYYELEIPDLEAGVDEVIRRGLADPERLASSGWSNGGILTAALITGSRRYRAAIVGAADVEWFSDWANVDFGAAFDNYYFGGPPWEIPEVYLEKSPFFRLESVTTPTLIHTGTEDRNVPPSQSWSLFRALQQIGKAPARLVLYPGEPHSLKKIAHQRRKIEEDMAWLARYLFGAEEKPETGVQRGSLLAGLLARSAAAQQDGVFGEVVEGVLVPETVRFRDLEVGRFEVTRAQFAAFDPRVEVGPGEENLPMTGLSYERARAYAAWLAERTGLPLRLPTKAEAERMTQDAGRSGNTLDLWAGYSPNPDDRRRILESVARLGDVPLLLPVGSRPAAEEAAIFDLDGNAAEWAATAGGGVAVGPSADRGREESSRAEAVGAYTGFRVVFAPGGG